MMSNETFILIRLRHEMIESWPAGKYLHREPKSRVDESATCDDAKRQDRD